MRAQTDISALAHICGQLVPYVNVKTEMIDLYPSGKGFFTQYMIGMLENLTPINVSHKVLFYHLVATDVAFQDLNLEQNTKDHVHV